MNSVGHFLISIAKSVLRIGACVVSIIEASVLPIAYGFLIAEILGILEEVVDKRD